MNKITYLTLFCAAVLATQAMAQTGSGSPFNVLKSSKTSVKESDLNRKSNGKVSADGKSIEFSGSNVRLVIHTGPDDDMMSYRIHGLRNPTLYVKPGANMEILFGNTDGDMFHNIRFGANQPPFAAGTTDAGTVGSDSLPHKTDKAVVAEKLTIKAPSKPGTYTYFCTIKGHAPAGMYGLIVVR